MTTYKCLLYDVKDGIATLTLNRPERLNALGDTLREDLHDAVMRASEDDQVRVIVVTGAGKGFCSGGDVKAMNERKTQGGERPLGEKVAPGRDRTVLALRDAPKPVIAAVNGAAAGAGMNLALACDIRLASTAAKFAQAFVRRGLHPDWGGTYFLPRVVGVAKAAELIWTGEIIEATEALRLGIVSAVHAPEDLMPAAHALAPRSPRVRPWPSGWPSARSTTTSSATSGRHWSSRPSPRTSASRPRTRARASAPSSTSGRRRSRAGEGRPWGCSTAGWPSSPGLRRGSAGRWPCGSGARAPASSAPRGPRIS